MDELTLEAVTHHNEGSQLSGENLAVEIEPLNFRPPRVELPDGRLRVLPLGQVVQLAECLVELTFFLRCGTDSLRKTGRAGFLLVFLSCLSILCVFIVVERPVLPDGKIFIFPVYAATVFTGRYALA